MRVNVRTTTTFTPQQGKLPLYCIVALDGFYIYFFFNFFLTRKKLEIGNKCSTGALALVDAFNCDKSKPPGWLKLKGGNYLPTNAARNVYGSRG